jgi:hypothetical protein
MVTNNKLDKSFGPVGTSAGVILFVVGLFTTFSSFYGLILVVLGAFVGFSSTSTFIDFEKKRIKFSNNLFGIIPFGKWISIEQTMKIGVRESNVTWRTYSGGNRKLDIEDQDYRIILYDSSNQEIMQIQKMNSMDAAKIETEKLSDQLGLNIV